MQWIGGDTRYKREKGGRSKVYGEYRRYTLLKGAIKPAQQLFYPRRMDRVIKWMQMALKEVWEGI